MTPPTISCTIDLNREGKQVGHLALPKITNTAGWASTFVHIGCIANGEGPTVLVLAGNHGDEYEGQVTLIRLIQDLEASDIKGRIIFMPAANLPAAMAGTRVSPLDAGNLNRAFPGNANGSPTWQIAHYIDDVVVPECDAWLDLHSGGGSLDYLPFAAFYQTGEEIGRAHV